MFETDLSGLCLCMMVYDKHCAHEKLRSLATGVYKKNIKKYYVLKTKKYLH